MIILIIIIGIFFLGSIGSSEPTNNGNSSNNNNNSHSTYNDGYYDVIDRGYIDYNKYQQSRDYAEGVEDAREDYYKEYGEEF